MKRLELKENQLPKGDYIITDPCYVLSDENYDKLICSETELDEKGNKKFETLDGIGKINETLLFSHGTLWGYGCYNDNENYEYGVDSGQIGCIPMELVDKDKLKGVDGERKRENGSSFYLIRKIHFPKNFKCSYDYGVFKFGDIVIPTN